ncbi:hypothetical protein H4R20_000348, partial [Coemansia guatemalensis]
SSGIEVNKACYDAFASMKKDRKYKFVIFKISDDFKEVVVDSTSLDDLKDKDGKVIPQKEDPFEEFVLRLPENSSRFAVFDYTKEPTVYNKLLFVSWAPDTASIKSKMLHASTKATFREGLNGIAVDIQATDSSEVTHDVVMEKLKPRI